MQFSNTWEESKIPLQKILDELDGQIKQLMGFKDLAKLQSQIDEIKELIEQIPQLKDTSDNITQLVATLQQRLDEITSLIPELEQQFGDLKNMGEKLPEVQEELKNLTAEIQKLKDEVGQIGGGSSENWVLIYDMASDDANINLGYTSGVLGGTSRINNLPNLKEYKRIKVVVYYNYSYNVYTLEIKQLGGNNFCFFAGDVFGETMISISIGVAYDQKSDFLRVYFPDITRIEFVTSKYPKIIDKNGNSLYYISKIEASVN